MSVVALHVYSPLMMLNLQVSFGIILHKILANVHDRQGSRFERRVLSEPLSLYCIHSPLRASNSPLYIPVLSHCLI